MSTRSLPDFESHPTLDAWLELGPTELSDAVIERARAEIHRTGRRNTWRLPWKTSTERPVRAAAMIALVAVIVISLIGVTLRIASTPAVGTQPSPSHSPKTGSFRPTGSMSIGRLGQTATRLLDGRVLVAGGSGWVEDGRPTGVPSTVPVISASAELYDPATGRFTVTGSMSTARAHHTATLLLDGRVLITGGGISGAEGDVDPLAQGFALASAELYDPITGQFTATGSMGAGRLWASAIRLKDGRVLIVGGSDSFAPNNTGPVKTAEIYDPTTGRFTPAGSFLGGSFSAPILLANGRVLGLTQPDGGGPTSIEIYDPATATFSSAGSLPDGCDNATTLADGRVLLVGGVAGAGVGAVARILAAQLYDPATGSLRPTGTPGIEFTALTATLLVDGRVLLDGFTGGASGSLPRTTIIYDPATETFDRLTDAVSFTPPNAGPSGRHCDAATQWSGPDRRWRRNRWPHTRLKDRGAVRVIWSQGPRRFGFFARFTGHPLSRVVVLATLALHLGAISTTTGPSTRARSRLWTPMARMGFGSAQGGWISSGA